MKIGIATIYDALNYGSFLQAYAMQKTLESMGNEVVILDCHLWTSKRMIKKWVSRTDFLFNFYKTLSYRIDLRQLNIQKSNQQRFDAVIIGSDEVWNLKGNFEHAKEYFGDHLNTERIIAYAPSLGFCSKDDFLSAEEAKNIKKFYALFPRDKITKEVCETLTERECPIVCDPTILLLDTWKNHMHSYKKKKVPYVLYYSYKNDTPMKEHIKRYAKENGYKVVIANFKYKWGDSIELPSPLQFLDLVNDAECVFTSTFHGSVFSTLFEKNVVIRPSGQKVVNYLHTLGLDEKIYQDDCSYDEFIKKIRAPIPYEKIKGFLSKQKYESIELLKESLKKD